MSLAGPSSAGDTDPRLEGTGTTRPLVKWKRRFVRAAMLLTVAFIAIQAVPYGRTHPNPPITAAAQWPSSKVESIARVACYACHSNETKWPVYSYIAPMSWLVRRDVELGRDELNFSEWDGDTDDAAEVVADRSMPPSRYVLLHPEARLSDAERRELLAALEAMERDNGRGDDRDGEDRGHERSGRGSASDD